MARDISPVPAPHPPPPSGRLGEKVEFALARVGTSVFNAIRQRVVDILAAGVELFLDVMETALAPRIAPLIDDVLSEPDIPANVRTFLGHIRNPSSQADAIGAMSFASGAAGGLGGAMFGPVFRRINQRIDSVMHTAIPDISSSLRMMWRDPASAEWIRDGMAGNGWGPQNQALWANILQPRLGAADRLLYQYRANADPEEANREFRRRGYDEATITRLQKLSQLMPGPGDLISMGVREVWDDVVARRWGYDKNFPDQFGIEMEKLGDKDGWARKYWRAHWVLPGLTTALEALHRLPEFTLDTLDEYLRISDIPAAWRDMIKKIAYVPFTRVDTRRMYKVGVLNEADVLKNYMDLGYDLAHAQKMADFTVADADEENREATKADILRGFREGMLTAAEATGWLVDLGYTADVAAFLVNQETAKRERALTDAWIALVKDQYINFDITRTQANSKLASYNLSASEIAVKLESWTIARERKIKHPSQSDVTKFFKRDQITEQVFRARLGYLGFPSDSVDLYIANALYEKAEAARVAEERARAEQEQIETRAITTGYQKNKAIIDVRVAQARTAITDQQIAMQARTSRFRQELAIVLEAVTVAQMQEQSRIDVDQLEADIQAFREAQVLLRSQIENLQTQISASRLTETEYQAQVGALVPEAQAAIATLREEIAVYQQDIDALQTQTATIRLQETEYTSGVVARFQEIDDAKAALRLDQIRYRQDIDALQTQIATIRLQETEHKRAYQEALNAATSEAEAEAIAIAAEAQIYDFERQRRVLAVRIEELQDQIAALNTQIQDLVILGKPDDPLMLEFERQRRELAVLIEELQDEIRPRTSQIVDLATVGRPDDVQLLEFERERRAAQLAIETAQDDIARATVEITTLQGAIADRQALLLTQIDVIQRIQTEEALRAQYEAAITPMQEALGDLRGGLLRLQESKAELAAAYREQLVQ